MDASEQRVDRVVEWLKGARELVGCQCIAGDDITHILVSKPEFITVRCIHASYAYSTGASSGKQTSRDAGARNKLRMKKFDKSLAVSLLVGCQRICLS